MVYIVIKKRNCGAEPRCLVMRGVCYWLFRVWAGAGVAAFIIVCFACVLLLRRPLVLCGPVFEIKTAYVLS